MPVLAGFLAYLYKKQKKLRFKALSLGSTPLLAQQDKVQFGRWRQPEQPLRHKSCSSAGTLRNSFFRACAISAGLKRLPALCFLAGFALPDATAGRFRLALLAAAGLFFTAAAFLAE